jgi:hypothetical protein
MPRQAPHLTADAHREIGPCPGRAGNKSSQRARYGDFVMEESFRKIFSGRLSDITIYLLNGLDR